MENGTYPHPYQRLIPAEYASVPRNFFLTTNLDPPHPWDYDSFYIHIDVFSMALVLGNVPNREWLVYTHAPLGTKQNVQITLPGFGSITVDSPPGGAFYYVDEKTQKATLVSNQTLNPPVNVRLLTQ